MIYSGLEFGQFFEMPDDPRCGNIMAAVTPAARMIFTFIQMYFVFLNAKVLVLTIVFHTIHRSLLTFGKF